MGLCSGVGNAAGCSSASWVLAWRREESGEIAAAGVDGGVVCCLHEAVEERERGKNWGYYMKNGERNGRRFLGLNLSFLIGFLAGSK